MATLLIHFISDFLRDTPSQPGQFGETLRCASLLNDATALATYGLNGSQIATLQTKSRSKILEAVSAEIGAVMDELDTNPGGLLYPAGSVELREVKLLFASGNDRTIVARGTGFDTAPTVTFTSSASVVTPGVIVKRACDPDVWQRLYVTVTLPADTYTVSVTSPSTGKADSKTITLT